MNTAITVKSIPEKCIHYNGMFPRFSQVQNQENSTIILGTVKKSNFLLVGSIPRK